MFETNPGQKTIIFCNSKLDCEDVAERLETLMHEHQSNSQSKQFEQQHNDSTYQVKRLATPHRSQRGAADRVAVVHGNKSQSVRDEALRAFRENQARVLVCSDVYARGLDVKDIELVVNFGMPRDFDSYIHRIGRTARGVNSTGTSVTFFTMQDAGLAKNLVRVLEDVGQEVPDQLRQLVPQGGGGGYGGRYGGGGRGGGGYGGGRGGGGGGYDSRDL